MKISKPIVLQSTIKFLFGLLLAGVLWAGTVQAAGDPDPASSAVVVSGSPATADGASQVTLTATILDGTGAPVSGETVTFEQPTGVSLDSTTCDTNASGECSINATSTIADDYTSTVSIGTVNVSNSPAAYTFAPGEVDAAMTTITADPVSIVADGVSTSTITVQAKDAFGNNLMTGGDSVFLVGLPNVGVILVTDEGGGRYTGELISELTVGQERIEGYISGIEITDTATVDFVPGAAHVTTSTITASPTSIEADGSTDSTITVQLTDVNGNDLVTGGDVVTLSSTAGVVGTVVDNTDGTYTAPLTSSTSIETATVTGKIDGAGITNNVTVDFVDTISPLLTQSYVSSGGTLLVLEYNEDLDESSVPETGDFTVADGAVVSILSVDVVGRKVILKLGKDIQAVDEGDGSDIAVILGYTSVQGRKIKDWPGGNSAVNLVSESAHNNSAHYPLRLMLTDTTENVGCGAYKISQIGSGPMEVLSSNCDTSIGAASTGEISFNPGSDIYCSTYDKLIMGASGAIRVTSSATGGDCLLDREPDGIIGTYDADPDAFPPVDCAVEVAYGEVNIDGGTANGNCHGTVAIVTGTDVAVGVNTVYTAGEFVRLLPGFSVVTGSTFSAEGGVIIPPLPGS